MDLKSVCGVSVVTILIASFVLAGCSSGPAPPAKGTPAFYWQAATETYAAGEYLKTVAHLVPLTKPDSEYLQRALPWRLVLTAGLATGLMSAADAFEGGSRASKTNPTEFRRQMNTYRTQSSKLALQFAETFLLFEKSNPPAAIPIAFGYPSGNAMPVTELAKIADGMAVPEGDVERAVRRAMERGVITTVCTAVGANENTAKAQQVLSGQNVTVPKDTFLLGMAAKLHELSKLFAPVKMHEPERLKLFLSEAVDAVKAVPPNEDTKKLQEKIEKDLKPLEKPT